MGTYSGTDREQVRGAMQDQPEEKEHHVLYARGAELPDDQCWAFVETEDTMWFVVREDHTAQQLEEAWAAFRALAC